MEGSSLPPKIHERTPPLPTVTASPQLLKPTPVLVDTPHTEHLLVDNRLKRERAGEPVPLTLADVEEAAKKRRVGGVDCFPDPGALHLDKFLFGK
jgi:hypothetical protein